MARSTLSRRHLLGATAFALTAAGVESVRSRAPLAPDRHAAVDPFTLGVASGDPTPDGVVLWTRLAPDPDSGGDTLLGPATVQWQVAADERFRQVIATGAEVAVRELGHSVHAEVVGLAAGTWYWYRFRTGRHVSPVGRTRTAPVNGVSTTRLAFALTSCQDYSSGYYTAHRHMAAEDLDVVVQVGDYLYEAAPDPSSVRRHDGTREVTTLEEYRSRHAQYRADPDLQACHAAFPWIVVLDDHEIDDNWAADVPADPDAQSHSAFTDRRTAALQAYYEHMPLRASSIPTGVHIQLYRRITFGDLLDLHVLDTRQYRSDQRQQARLDPSRTMLGAEQERWLLANLAGRTARWNALAQQVFFSQRDLTAGPDTGLGDDGWDGYAHARNSLRDRIKEVRASNPVILTGDVHSSYVCDVKADFDDPSSDTIATELVASSISSGGDGVDHGTDDAAHLRENPHIRLVNRQRGYLRNIVTPDSWTADVRVVDVVTSPGAPIRTQVSVAIEDHRAGAVPT